MEAAEVLTYDEFSPAGDGTVMISSDGKTLYIKCPGCGQASAMTLGGDVHPRWNVVQRTPLTLEPSVNCTGCCGWHGFLRNGEWEKC